MNSLNQDSYTSQMPSLSSRLIPLDLICRGDQEPKELPGEYFVLHTVKDALMNELPFQVPALQPLLSSQCQAQQGPDVFHPSQDVVNNGLGGFEPGREKSSLLHTRDKGHKMHSKSSNITLRTFPVPA